MVLLHIPLAAMAAAQAAADEAAAATVTATGTTTAAATAAVAAPPTSPSSVLVIGGRGLADVAAGYGFRNVPAAADAARVALSVALFLNPLEGEPLEGHSCTHRHSLECLLGAPTLLVIRSPLCSPAHPPPPILSPVDFTLTMAPHTPPPNPSPPLHHAANGIHPVSPTEAVGVFQPGSPLPLRGSVAVTVLAGALDVLGAPLTPPTATFGVLSPPRGHVIHSAPLAPFLVTLSAGDPASPPPGRRRGIGAADLAAALADMAPRLAADVRRVATAAAAAERPGATAMVVLFRTLP